MKVNEEVRSGIVRAYERGIEKKVNFIGEITSRACGNKIAFAELVKLKKLVKEFEKFLDDNGLIEYE